MMAYTAGMYNIRMLVREVSAPPEVQRIGEDAHLSLFAAVRVVS